MPSRKKQKSDESPDPDSVTRESAGTYRSGDGRFLVQQSDVTWFLVDTQQTNELGQELMHGPFATLKAAREAIPGARSITPVPKLRPSPVHTRDAKPPPPPPTPSWIDELGPKEAGEVRRLIRALEREGIEDAEQLIRRERQLNQPLVAARLLERRLDALVNGAGEMDDARKLVRRAAQILAGDDPPPHPLPRWGLFETAWGDERPGRRVRPPC